VFNFYTGDGRDVIKDFGIGNDAVHEDMVLGTGYEITKNNHGDAVILHGDGDRIILDGVRMNQLEDHHFVTPI
jgi:hypothetical protein